MSNYLQCVYYYFSIIIIYVFISKVTEARVNHVRSFHDRLNHPSHIKAARQTTTASVLLIRFVFPLLESMAALQHLKLF